MIMEKMNVPYSVVTQGQLSFFKEDIPLWMVMLLVRINHFNSKRGEKYAMHLDKEAIKLRVTPDVILLAFELMTQDGELQVDKVNSGLYLVQLSEKLSKELDLVS
jgi:hypothetical protein